MTAQEMGLQVIEALYLAASGYWVTELELNAARDSVERVQRWIEPSQEVRDFLRAYDPTWRPPVTDQDLPQAVH